MQGSSFDCRIWLSRALSGPVCMLTFREHPWEINTLPSLLPPRPLAEAAECLAQLPPSQLGTCWSLPGALPQADLEFLSGSPRQLGCWAP